VEFKLKWFGKNLEKKLSRHSERSLSAGAGHSPGEAQEAAQKMICAVISEVMVGPTVREMADATAPEGTDDGSSRTAAMREALVRSFRTQASDIWRLEFKRVERANETDPGLLRELFKRIDRDGSGTLERDEIRLISSELGKELSEAELDEAMRSVHASVG
jgi:hypothetical protein